MTSQRFLEPNRRGVTSVWGILVVIFAAILAVALAVGLYLYYAARPTVQNNVTNPPNTPTSLTEPSPQLYPTPAAVPPEQDEDGDGYLLSDEQKAGTDPAKNDTDGDGLKDGEEVFVWKTDPLRKDTDSDGFSDQEEILNGHDPLAR